eukprot:Plantae.Rhodophyta-Palmaria_palmata.ctg8870.p2 GENE.Plantae.Rhodophyta-Palmaria_palmata.ctg8870~~Plantae.Rhodophyta-Palmaria_palmata.ctg8870.p2  ORF type:complete len:149 (-),score=14.24 Plantae.Rhodophyta-Palmaria_palmata.ctg8870:137-583(-)
MVYRLLRGYETFVDCDLGQSLCRQCDCALFLGYAELLSTCPLCGCFLFSENENRRLIFHPWICFLFEVIALKLTDVFWSALNASNADQDSAFHGFSSFDEENSFPQGARKILRCRYLEDQMAVSLDSRHFSFATADVFRQDSARGVVW